MKESKLKLKGWMIGGLFGLVIGIIKYLVGGFTWFDYSTYQAIFNIIYLPISFAFLIYIFQKCDTSKFKDFIFLSLSVLILICLKSMFLTEFKDLFICLFILIFLIMMIGTMDLIFSFIGFLLFKLLNKKKSILRFISVLNIWFFFVMATIDDMFQHFNPGGASGRWYIYGDYLFLIGIIIVIFWQLSKK